MAHRAAILVPAVLILAGCPSAPKPDFNSPEPAARNAAIVRAAADRDQSRLDDLVRMLDSDDPATRLLAIRTLERLTGQTLGYDHADPEWKRRDGVDRWVRFADERRQAPARPENSGPPGSSPAGVADKPGP